MKATRLFRAYYCRKLDLAENKIGYTHPVESPDENNNKTCAEPNVTYL